MFIFVGQSYLYLWISFFCQDINVNVACDPFPYSYVGMPLTQQ